MVIDLIPGINLQHTITSDLVIIKHDSCLLAKDTKIIDSKCRTIEKHKTGVRCCKRVIYCCVLLLEGECILFSFHFHQSSFPLMELTLYPHTCLTSPNKHQHLVYQV